MPPHKALPHRRLRHGASQLAILTRALETSAKKVKCERCQHLPSAALRLVSDLPGVLTRNKGCPLHHARASQHNARLAPRHACAFDCDYLQPRCLDGSIRMCARLFTRVCVRARADEQASAPHLLSIDGGVVKALGTQKVRCAAIRFAHLYNLAPCNRARSACAHNETGDRTRCQSGYTLTIARA